MTGLWVLLAVLAASTVAGVWHRRRQGRWRRGRATAQTQTQTPTPTRTALAAAGAQLGSRATLLQFSSAFCSPCRATRRILGEVAEAVEGVSHVELDAEGHLDLVRALDIRKTPTTLVLDASGAEVLRASGQPRKAEVLAALAEAVP